MFTCIIIFSNYSRFAWLVFSSSLFFSNDVSKRHIHVSHLIWIKEHTLSEKCFSLFHFIVGSSSISIYVIRDSERPHAKEVAQNWIIESMFHFGKHKLFVVIVALFSMPSIYYYSFELIIIIVLFCKRALQAKEHKINLVRCVFDTKNYNRHK